MLAAINRGQCEMDKMSNSPIFRGVALVVDDDQSTCDIVAAILEDEGFTVTTANSGEEALEHFGSHVFDIVFTDICMDGISGLELLDRISNMDETIKTVIMTAHGGYDTVLQALQGGAYDYIEKPILNHQRLAAVARKASLMMHYSRKSPCTSAMRILFQCCYSMWTISRL